MLFTNVVLVHDNSEHLDPIMTMNTHGSEYLIY